MLPDGRRLGAHLPLAQGMVRAVERANAIGLDTLQIFADNPTAWRRRLAPPRELPAFRARLAELGMGPIAIHAAYLINLAGADDAFVARSIEVLASELRVAPAFRARFVNVHIGSHRGLGTEAGAARLADGIARVLERVEPGPDAATLVLENSAGSGDSLGSSLDEIGAILEAVADRGVPAVRVGVCLDTAHLWAAGIPLATAGDVDRLVRTFDERIGLERLVMIHLNDSKAKLGSRLDRHEHLGEGAIGPTGLAALLTHPRLSEVATYLETPGMDEGYDAINAGRAHDLAAGRPVAPLPAATTVRGARARSGPPPNGVAT